ILAQRDALPATARAAAAVSIVDGIVALASFIHARTVLLTMAFRTEWNTEPLIRAALDAGKTVALPRVDVNSRMLVLHAIADPQRDITVGYRGIPEPALQCSVIA